MYLKTYEVRSWEADQKNFSYEKTRVMSTDKILDSLKKRKLYLKVNFFLLIAKGTKIKFFNGLS